MKFGDKGIRKVYYHNRQTEDLVFKNMFGDHLFFAGADCKLDKNCNIPYFGILGAVENFSVKEAALTLRILFTDNKEYQEASRFLDAFDKEVKYVFTIGSNPYPLSLSQDADFGPWEYEGEPAFLSRRYSARLEGLQGAELCAELTGDLSVFDDKMSRHDFSAGDMFEDGMEIERNEKGHITSVKQDRW